MTLRDQEGGGAVLLLRDSSMPSYFPEPTTGAARVELWARDANKGIDTAFKVAEGKPGGGFSIPTAVLTNRDLLFTTISFSASGVPSSDLARATWQTLSVTANAGTAAGLDGHVPTVTEAPVVAKAVTADEWVVFTPMPDAYGATLTGCDIHVEKASDSSVFEVWEMLPVGASHRIEQKAYASKIRYRWRNQSAEDAGNGRGVSAWSPFANAAEIGAGTPNPAPGTVLSTFDPDPADSRAGIETGVING